MTTYSMKVDRKHHKKLLGEMRTPLFQNICNGKIKAIFRSNKGQEKNASQRCHFLHHSSPFLMLGPFHLDIKLRIPFRSIYRDFFTAKEINWMTEYSLPRLSATRILPQSTVSLSKSEIRHRDSSNTNVGYVFGKAIQTWFSDIKYNEKPHHIKFGKPPTYYDLQVKHPYSYSVTHPIMHKISRKIELSSDFNVTTRYGASNYQTTNYGLSGLIATHVDPWGHESGKHLPKDRKDLLLTGDYIATFMGWFAAPKAGGGTAFDAAGYEDLIDPNAGDAAFWINLSSNHSIDKRARHAGCPVLKGSKWILNKWIYSWDQWKKWPCNIISDTAIEPNFHVS